MRGIALAIIFAAVALSPEPAQKLDAEGHAIVGAVGALALVGAVICIIIGV